MRQLWFPSARSGGSQAYASSGRLPWRGRWGSARGLGSQPRLEVASPLGPPPTPALSRSFTTSTKEAQSRPFSLLPPEPCDRPWENPDSCPRPT